MTDKEYQHALDLLEKGIRADERARVLDELINYIIINGDDGKLEISVEELEEWNS